MNAGTRARSRRCRHPPLDGGSRPGEPRRRNRPAPACPRLDFARSNRFAQRDRDRGRRCVAIAVDVHEDDRSAAELVYGWSHARHGWPGVDDQRQVGGLSWFAVTVVAGIIVAAKWNTCDRSSWRSDCRWRSIRDSRGRRARPGTINSSPPERSLSRRRTPQRCSAHHDVAPPSPNSTQVLCIVDRPPSVPFADVPAHVGRGRVDDYRRRCSAQYQPQPAEIERTGVRRAHPAPGWMSRKGESGVTVATMTRPTRAGHRRPTASCRGTPARRSILSRRPRAAAACGVADDPLVGRVNDRARSLSQHLQDRDAPAGDFGYARRRPMLLAR